MMPDLTRRKAPNALPATIAASKGRRRAGHHRRHHRETRLIGGVGTGAMEGQTVMEAGLTGLQDTGLIKPFAPPRCGKARRLLLQVLCIKPCALRDQAPFVRADNGPHTAIAEIGIL